MSWQDGSHALWALSQVSLDAQHDDGSAPAAANLAPRPASMLPNKGKCHSLDSGDTDTRASKLSVPACLPDDHHQELLLGAPAGLLTACDQESGIRASSSSSSSSSSSGSLARSTSGGRLMSTSRLLETVHEERERASTAGSVDMDMRDAASSQSSRPAQNSEQQDCGMQSRGCADAHASDDGSVLMSVFTTQAPHHSFTKASDG